MYGYTNSILDKDTITYPRYSPGDATYWGPTGLPAEGPTRKVGLTGRAEIKKKKKET
jgi:hypothetical protein